MEGCVLLLHQFADNNDLFDLVFFLSPGGDVSQL